LEILLVVFGNIILAIGTGFFLVPANIVAGGMSGLAIIANNLFGFDIDYHCGYPFLVSVLCRACISW
jgi:uncharacterized membrane-anchored protein YitT (DUF2179 family)